MEGYFDEGTAAATVREDADGCDPSSSTGSSSSGGGVLGPSDGVAPRAIHELLRCAAAAGPTWRYEFTMSMLQIYNETIQDLLFGEQASSNGNSSSNNNTHGHGKGSSTGSSSSASANREGLAVRQATDGSQYVAGLSSYPVSCAVNTAAVLVVRAGMNECMHVCFVWYGMLPRTCSRMCVPVYACVCV